MKDLLKDPLPPEVPYLITFDYECLRILQEPKSLFSGDLINGFGELFSKNIFPNAATIFDTYLFNQKTVDRVHRKAAFSECWKTSVWVIPIHLERLKHWALATVYPEERLIHIFDSMALQDHMQLTAEVSCNFVEL